MGGHSPTNRYVQCKNSLFEQIWMVATQQQLPCLLAVNHQWQRGPTQRGSHEHFPHIPGNIGCTVSAASITYLRYLCWLLQKMIRSVGTTPSVYNSISKQQCHAEGNENGFLGRVCMELHGVFCLYFRWCNGLVIWYAKLWERFNNL